jgi:hypothetical protein
MFGADQFRARGAHKSAKSLETVLRYVSVLERTTAAERTRRAEFEANAEGEFAELRLQVRAWQAYAAQLADRRDHLRERLRGLLDWLGDWADTAWWRWLARRSAWVHVEWEFGRARDAVGLEDPTPPVVEP